MKRITALLALCLAFAPASVFACAMYIPPVEDAQPQAEVPELVTAMDEIDLALEADTTEEAAEEAAEETDTSTESTEEATVEATTHGDEAAEVTESEES